MNKAQRDFVHVEYINSYNNFIDDILKIIKETKARLIKKR